jgi:MerR family transcriptional regulator/heat shock protein HspR
MSGNPFEVADDSPVYVISVAAELSGLHPQTLRAYDRLGLVSPGRSSGRGRRYSLRDVLMLREVQRLSQEDGVNLSGIKQILELGAELDRARRLLTEMTAEIAQLRAELESTRAVAARLAGLVRNRAAGAQLVPVRNLGGSVPSAGPVAPEQVLPATSNAPTSSGPTSHAANSGAPNSGAANSGAAAPFEESH